MCVCVCVKAELFDHSVMLSQSCVAGEQTLLLRKQSGIFLVGLKEVSRRGL